MSLEYNCLLSFVLFGKSLLIFFFFLRKQQIMNLADSPEFHMLLWRFSLDFLRTSLYNKTLSLKF